MDELSIEDRSPEPGAAAAPSAHLRQIIDQAHARLRDGDAHSALQAVILALQLGGEQAAMPAVMQVREALGRGQQSGIADVVQQLGRLLDACSLSAAAPRAADAAMQAEPARMQRQLNQLQSQHPQQQLPTHGHAWQLHTGRPPDHQAHSNVHWQQPYSQQQQVDSVTASFQNTSLHQRPPELQMGSSVMTMGAAMDPLTMGAADHSFVCPRCGGVVSEARRDAHERLWCPAAVQ